MGDIIIFYITSIILYLVSPDCGANVGHTLRCLQYTHVATGRHCGRLLFPLVREVLRYGSYAPRGTLDSTWSDHICNISALALWLWCGKCFRLQRLLRYISSIFPFLLQVTEMCDHFNIRCFKVRKYRRNSTGKSSQNNNKTLKSH